jgi:hypothetical protein
MPDKFALTGDGKVYPVAPTGDEIASNPGKFDGTPFDPVIQPAPSMRVLKQFVEDHAEGEEKWLGHPETKEDVNKVFHATDSKFNYLTWAEFFKGNPLSATLWIERALGTPWNPVRFRFDRLTEAQRESLGLTK